MICDIQKYIDKYTESGIILDIRDDVILAFKDEFIFEARKLGEFWYIKVDKGG